MDTTHLQTKLEQLEQELYNPDFWSDKIRAQEVLREIEELKTKLNGGGKYDSGNHAVSNWLEGLEFYEFHKAPSDTAYKKGRTPEQKAMFRWLDDEQDRYKARAKISRKIKNVTGRIKRLKDRYKSFNLVLKGRIKGAIPRSELLSIQNDYDKKLIDLTGVRDSLIRQLHLTRGF